MIVVWNDYMQYKAKLRGFDLDALEKIIKFSPERYSDVVTGRRIAVGQYNNRLLLIPYESDENSITPVTVHVSSRQQVNARKRSGRFIYE